MNLISTGFIRTVTIQSIRVTYAALTGTSSTYIYLHLHLQHISWFFAEALEVFHKKHDLFRQIQMNGRGLGPTSEVAHWRIWLAPCEFPVQQGDCESIAVVHSIESLSDHKILVRIIHLDHFDPETACSLLSIGFPSAQLKQNYTDDTFDGPMTSRFFHRLQGLGKNYYWPQDRSPRSRDISTDRFWCCFSTCVDVQTCVYKMRQYTTYVHTKLMILMYMIMILNINVTYIKPTSYIFHRFAVPGNVLPRLV